MIDYRTICGYALIIIGLIAIFAVIWWIIRKKGFKNMKSAQRLASVIIILIGNLMAFQGMRLAQIIQIYESGVDLYGCPNSKRIAKLNIRKRRFYA